MTLDEAMKTDYVRERGSNCVWRVSSPVNDYCLHITLSGPLPCRGCRIVTLTELLSDWEVHVREAS
jgi:hypothetical protein